MAEEIKYNIAVTGTGQAVAGINAVTIAQQRLTATSANAGVALQSLNFVIRDSPYFFRDFSLGVLAVGNNINPLIDSMLRLKQEAKLVNQTLGQTLVAALKGPAGLVLAFSVLVTVLQAVTFAMAKTKSGAKEAEKNIDDLSDSIDNLSQSFGDAIKKQEEYNKEMGKAAIEAEIAQLEIFKQRGYTWERPFGGDPKERPQKVLWGAENQRQLDELKEKVKNIAQPFQDFVTKIQLLNAAASLNVKAIRDLKMAYGDITDSITYFSKLQKTFDAEDPMFQYYAKIIKNLKEYQDEIEKTHKKKIKYLEAEALGYKFASEQEEKLFRKRMDLMDQIRERAIRGGMSPEQAEAFGLGMSMQLQGEPIPMWGGGYKKVGKRGDEALIKPVKETNRQLALMRSLGTEVGEVLANAFLGAKITLDSFISSLTIAIIKMAILNTINSFMPGRGGNGGSGGLLKKVFSPANYGGSSIDITINGILEAKQNKFVVDLSRAQKKYNSNMRYGNVSYIET